MTFNSNSKTHRHILLGKIVVSLLVLCSSSALAQDNLKFSKSKIINKMTHTDFTTTLFVDKTPEAAFNAINNVRGWWSEEIEGPTNKLNDEFNYHFEDLHRAQLKLIEVIRNKKVVWLVKENYFKFTKDKTEWTGTKIIFEISAQNKQTQIQFTHLGLVPDYECYEICEDAWTNYIQNSLRIL